MTFRRRAHAGRRPARLGILPGAFNPPTLAHLALAEAALAQSAADEVVFVLPRSLPHKEFSGATLDQRLDMLSSVCSAPALSVAVSDGGLFVEIARECREAYGEQVQLAFLCGRDAAERIIAWDYGRPGVVGEMLRQFDLLVAARRGEYAPPPEFRAAVRALPLAGDFDHVSGSEVRARIARGDPWEHLVPPAIHGQVRQIFTQEVAPDRCGGSKSDP